MATQFILNLFTELKRTANGTSVREHMIIQRGFSEGYTQGELNTAIKSMLEAGQIMEVKGVDTVAYELTANGRAAASQK